MRPDPVAALPDCEAREARALAAEPEYVKAIRALCARAGQELDRVTAGDPNYVHQGLRTIAWHFLTDQGHHYMVGTDDEALMFEDKTGDLVARIDLD